jgi:hypothetical protein
MKQVIVMEGILAWPAAGMVRPGTNHAGALPRYHQGMKDGPNIAGVAALIGDRARSEILTALLGGQALTATELSGVADVNKSTTWRAKGAIATSASPTTTWRSSSKACWAWPIAPARFA